MKDYQKEYYGLYRKGKRSKLKYKRCRDCGKMFFANSKDNQTTRCKECQHERDKELNRISSRERMRKYRNK